MKVFPTLDPIELIEGLPELREHLHAILAEIDSAGVRAAGQWTGLRNLGAQRADHAAALLRDVAEHMEALAEYAVDCRDQLAKAIANPFGD
jgi:hypothetical protein